MSDGQNTSSVSISITSEDVNGGTSDGNVLNLGSSREKLKSNIVLSYSCYLTNDQKAQIKEFVNSFPVRLSNSMDEITHFIPQTNENGLCIFSVKYLDALLSHCFIVKTEWVEKCIQRNTLIAELDYIPCDNTSVPTPLMSWRVGKGIIDSPMQWTKSCIIYTHKSVKKYNLYEDIQRWARKLGIVLTKEIHDLNNTKYDIRVVLVNDDFQIPEDLSMTPTSLEAIEWIYKYKSVPIVVQWLIDCLSTYKFVVFTPAHQFCTLDSYKITMMEMNPSLFSLT